MYLSLTPRMRASHIDVSRLFKSRLTVLLTPVSEGSRCRVLPRSLGESGRTPHPKKRLCGPFWPPGQFSRGINWLKSAQLASGFMQHAMMLAGALHFSCFDVGWHQI